MPCLACVGICMPWHMPVVGHVQDSVLWPSVLGRASAVLLIPQFPPI